MTNQVTIGDLLRDGAIIEIQDGNHGAKHPTTADYVATDGVPFVMARDFPEGSLNLDNATLLSREVAAKLRIGFARPADVLLTHKGTVGATGIVPEGHDYLMLTPQVTYYRTNPKKLLNTFLRSAFRSAAFQQQLSSFSAQSTRPFVSISAQRLLSVPLPPMPTQRRIAGILSAYDDLIENCQRRIKVLDEMARALYREWFVELRYPGMQASGKLPSGWRRGSAGEIAEEVRRNVAKGGIGSSIYVGLEHIPRRCLALDSWQVVEELGSNKLEFKAGEVLFGKIRPYFHKVAIAPGDGVCSADTFVIQPRDPKLYALMVGLVSSDEFVAHASATANGAKMPRANWDVMMQFSTVIPSDSVLSRFDGVMRPWLSQQRTLVAQVRNLRETRNLLLPRLLSGQLDVSDVA